MDYKFNFKPHLNINRTTLTFPRPKSGLWLHQCWSKRRSDAEPTDATLWITHASTWAQECHRHMKGCIMYTLEGTETFSGAAALSLGHCVAGGLNNLPENLKNQTASDPCQIYRSRAAGPPYSLFRDQPSPWTHIPAINLQLFPAKQGALTALEPRECINKPFLDTRSYNWLLLQLRSEMPPLPTHPILWVKGLVPSKVCVKR